MKEIYKAEGKGKRSLLDFGIEPRRRACPGQSTSADLCLGNKIYKYEMLIISVSDPIYTPYSYINKSIIIEK